MSPLPLFLLATALLAAMIVFHLARLCLAPFRIAPIARRRQRAQEQIRWDEMHPPA